MSTWRVTKKPEFVDRLADSLEPSVRLPFPFPLQCCCSFTHDTHMCACVHTKETRCHIPRPLHSNPVWAEGNGIGNLKQLPLYLSLPDGDNFFYIFISKNHPT